MAGAINRGAAAPASTGVEASGARMIERSPSLVQYTDVSSALITVGSG